MRSQFLIVLLAVSFIQANAQTNKLHYYTELQSVITSDSTVPFWMRSNQYGSIPLEGLSASSIAGVRKEYDSSNLRFWDWGFSALGRANVGNKANFTLLEGYGKIKAGIVELKVGRAREIFGLVDSTLSSGSFSISGNALGIPKAQLGIPEYAPILGSKLLALKGNISFGWMDKLPVQYTWAAPANYPHVEKAKTTFHQKTLYGRFGKQSWRWKAYAGFNHEVTWGDERSIYGPDWTLSKTKSLIYALKGGVYRNASVPLSRVGNHLGSIDVAFEYNFKKISLFAYRQSFYESGALAHLANLLDGLNGLSITNRNEEVKNIKWKKVLFEVFFTKNQASELWSKTINSGTEDYYNHSMYTEGWSYKKLGLGNPFITAEGDARGGFPSVPSQYFINNRVLLFHTGIEGSVKSINVLAKISYSKNYGTYATSEIGTMGQNRRDPPRYGIFQKANQFSTYLEINKKLNNGFTLGGVAALDRGKLLPDATGLLIKVSRTF